MRWNRRGRGNAHRSVPRRRECLLETIPSRRGHVEHQLGVSTRRFFASFQPVVCNPKDSLSERLRREPVTGKHPLNSIAPGPRLDGSEDRLRCDGASVFASSDVGERAFDNDPGPLAGIVQP